LRASERIARPHRRRRDRMHPRTRKRPYCLAIAFQSSMVHGLAWFYATAYLFLLSLSLSLSPLSLSLSLSLSLFPFPCRIVPVGVRVPAGRTTRESDDNVTPGAVGECAPEGHRGWRGWGWGAGGTHAPRVYITGGLRKLAPLGELFRSNLRSFAGQSFHEEPRRLDSPPLAGERSFRAR